MTSLEIFWPSLTAAHNVLCMSVAIMLLLRVLVRHRFGADIAYQLWLILPLAMIASTLPAPTVAPEIILMGRSALPGAAAVWDQEAAFTHRSEI